MAKNILVVEDDKNVANLVTTYFENEKWNVKNAFDGEVALDIAYSESFDLVVLDLMLPKLSGIEFIKEYRNEYNTPVIMLTAKITESDIIKGLDLGADDYVTKPFSFNELSARIKAVLRRSDPKVVANELIFEDLKLDRIEKRVFRSDKEIQLGPTEFRLLEFFLTNPKRVYSRDQILETVWPNNVNVESRTIDVHIRRLRQSINIEGKKELIRTVRASGYSLV